MISRRNDACCIVLLFLALVSATVNASIPIWVSRNCTTRFICGSDAALCLGGQCRLCNGLNTAVCEENIDQMQKCLPIDTSLNPTVCFGSNETETPCTCRHKPLLFNRNLDLLDIIGSLLVFLFSAIAAGGGIGGGGIFVPILILVFRFTARDAIPLSNVLILGASVANFAQLAPRRLPHSSPPQPMIDYDMAIALQPTSMAGTIIGVLLNAVFPDWLILALLVVTLGVSVWRSSLKGISLCKIERKDRKNPQTHVVNETEIPIQTIVDPRIAKVQRAAAKFPYLKIGFLLFALAIVTVHTIIVGTPSRPSLVGIVLCSPVFIGVYIAVFPVFAILVLGVGIYHLREQKKKETMGYIFGKFEFQWTKLRIIVIGIISFVSGILASLLGVGGGMILSPLMLELNLHPESVAATSTFMILFTAASSTIQFSIANRVAWDYGAMFVVIGIFTSAFGQTVLTAVMRKYDRRSVVVWIIVGIIILSAILLVIVGGIDLSNRVSSGASLGFKSLCP